MCSGIHIKNCQCTFAGTKINTLFSIHFETQPTFKEEFVLETFSERERDNGFFYSMADAFRDVSKKVLTFMVAIMHM